MSYQISCRELGMWDCDFLASGETPGDVLKKLLPHLRKEHHLQVPEAGAILNGEPADDILTGNPGEDVRIVTQRLREALDLPRDGEKDPESGPVIGRLPNG